VGFVPNASARQLRAGVSTTICILVPDLANPFFAELIRGVERRAELDSLAVFVSSSEADPERESRYLRVILEEKPRGVLLTPGGGLDAPLNIIGGRLPMVLVDREGPADMCSVAVDDFRGGSLAVQHLAALGHVAITWVVGPLSIPQCATRTEGVRYAAGTCAMSLDVVEVAHLSVDVGRRVAAGIASTGKCPTAIVCANDLLALGVENELLARGIGVPTQISVVGFDDIEYASAAAVALTTVSRPALDLGTTALEMLLEETGAMPHRHRQVLFQPRLVVRKSTARPPS
jgi:LacI family transcriptional regulator